MFAARNRDIRHVLANGALPLDEGVNVEDDGCLDDFLDSLSQTQSIFKSSTQSKPCLEPKNLEDISASVSALRLNSPGMSSNTHT